MVGTFGFIGHLKPAPGTYGSLAAAAIWWFLIPAAIPIKVILILVVSVLGVWSAGIVEREVGANDPSIVIIDEVAGMWCALAGAPAVLWHFLAAFLIFRLLDILKPWPIRQLQNLHGGWGIMADDLLAGVITLVIMTIMRLVI
ncbi:phosphatidylglycerophosphatase A [Candidatus Neomarinimicrobiota bacterium]